MKYLSRTIEGFFLVVGLAIVALALVGATSAQPTPAPAPHSLRATAELQWALDNAGAHLDINGKWGPATQAALEQYQQAVGLQPTGKLNKATRSWLDMAG